MSHPLHQKMSTIRDLINSPRKQHTLFQDSILWAMLCSCMDTVEDTEEALESFLKINTDSSDKGRHYLRIYGALQALIVQQEAVKNLHEALGIQYIEDSSLEEIRHIRIDAAGHPTNRGKKKAFNFINRATLSSQSFQLITYYRTNSGNGKLDSKRENINVPDLIAAQKNVFVDVLNNIIETLREEEVEHRRKFMGKKLIGAFQDTRYPFQKVMEATLSIDSPHAESVGAHVDQILKSIEMFKAGLKERDEPEDNIEHIYENLDYALQHIKAYFHNNNETHICRKDAYIFADFAKRELKELQKIAKEIDKKYSQT